MHDLYELGCFLGTIGFFGLTVVVLIVAALYKPVNYRKD